MKNKLGDTIAEKILAMMPLYHRYILRSSAGISGIRIAQYRALGMLMKCGALSMSELGSLLFISKPSMTILVDTLVENAWAERLDDLKDRRVIRISITPKGKKHLRHAFEIFHADVKDKISILEPEDLEKMSTALDELHRIFSKLEG
jgi:DNA-binding MarR family transcriptional regulator